MKLPKINHAFLSAGCMCLWVLVQMVLFLKSGVKISVDSPLYISGAMDWMGGNLPNGRNIWYSSYSAFIAGVFWFGGDAKAVVVIQLLFSGIAAGCLYALAIEWFDRTSAILVVLFYSLWIPLQEWNTFVYTESLFTSCCIISLAALTKSKNTWQYVLSTGLILFTFFLRPTGFAFAVGLICYFLYSIGSRSSKIKRAVFIVLTLLSAVVLSLMLKDYTLIESYSKAEIIYPNISLGLEVPTNLYIPAQDHSTLVRVIQFAFYNPVYFMKLVGLKLLLFIGNVKPYFSWLHNMLIVVFVYPLYWFAMKGFIHFPKPRKEKYFIAGFVIVQALAVALTTENWDGRFLIPILPFIFLLAAWGLVKAVKKFTN